MNSIIRLAVDFGEWLEKVAKNKNNAIILVILSLISPLGFVFAASMIAHSYWKNRKKR